MTYIAKFRPITQDARNLVERERPHKPNLYKEDKDGWINLLTKEHVFREFRTEDEYKDFIKFFVPLGWEFKLIKVKEWSPQ